MEPTVPGAALLLPAPAGRLGISQWQKTKPPASSDTVRRSRFQIPVHVEIAGGRAGVQNRSTDPADSRVLRVLLRILGY